MKHLKQARGPIKVVVESELIDKIRHELNLHVPAKTIVDAALRLFLNSKRESGK